MSTPTDDPKFAGNIIGYLLATRSMVNLMLLRKDLDQPTRLSMLGLLEHLDAVKSIMGGLPETFVARLPELADIWKDVCEAERTRAQRERAWLVHARLRMLSWLATS